LINWLITLCKWVTVTDVGIRLLLYKESKVKAVFIILTIILLDFDVKNLICKS
jgi:hypothetical protein